MASAARERHLLVGVRVVLLHADQRGKLVKLYALVVSDFGRDGRAIRPGRGLVEELVEQVVEADQFLLRAAERRPTVRLPLHVHEVTVMPDTARSQDA